MLLQIDNQMHSIAVEPTEVVALMVQPLLVALTNAAFAELLFAVESMWLARRLLVETVLMDKR